MPMEVGGGGRTECINNELVDLPKQATVEWKGKKLDHMGLLADKDYNALTFDNPKQALATIRDARDDGDEDYVYVATKLAEGEHRGKWIVDRYWVSGDADLDELEAAKLPHGAIIVDQDGKAGFVGGENSVIKEGLAAARHYFGSPSEARLAAQEERGRQAQKKLMHGLDENLKPTKLGDAFDVDGADRLGVGLRRK